MSVLMVLGSMIKNYLFYLLFLTLIQVELIGQNCSCISGTKNKQDGTETVGGVTTSKDFYSLLFHKQLNEKDTSKRSKYIMSLHAASKGLLKDSVLKTVGTIELKLFDNSTVKIGNVEFLNNPIGLSPAIGFQVFLTKEQVELISTNPIITLKIIDFALATSFSEKKQKEQQRILKCLLSKN